MVSGDLLREARLRAGLTQAELAREAGKCRSHISRYERGDVLPSLETLRRLVRACGLELGFRLYNADLEDDDAALIAQTLPLTPEERVEPGCSRGTAHLPQSERRRTSLADFEPGRMLRFLEAHHVRYVVIGAIAAIAAGAPILTTDLDVTPERSEENLQRLALALRDLDAEAPYREPTRAVSRSRSMPSCWRLGRRAGRSRPTAGGLDLVFSPAGTRGYEDLRRGARRERIAGVSVPVAALADVIRFSKEAAGRERTACSCPYFDGRWSRLVGANASTPASSFSRRYGRAISD